MQAATTSQKKSKNIYTQNSFTHNEQHPLTPPKIAIRILITSYLQNKLQHNITSVSLENQWLP